MNAAHDRTPITVTCVSCGADVVITCEGLSGVDDYPIYSHFECPHCLKTGAAKTPGHIVAVSPS